MAVFVNGQPNVTMHRIYQHYVIIVYLILFSMSNGVLKHLVINHDGIILLGLMYVLNRFVFLFDHTISYLFPQCDCMSTRRRRSVTCVRLGKTVNDRDCIHEPKPDEIVSCYDECNNPHWETHLWEPVSSR